MSLNDEFQRQTNEIALDYSKIFKFRFILFWNNFYYLPTISEEDSVFDIGLLNKYMYYSEHHYNTL